MNIPEVDYSPLEREISDSEADAYRLAKAKYSDKEMRRKILIVSIIVIPIVYLATSTVVVMNNPVREYDFLFSFSIWHLIGYTALVAFIYFLAGRHDLEAEKKKMRTEEFMSKNNFTIQNYMFSVPHDGLVFKAGISQSVSDVITMQDGLIEIGRYAYNKSKDKVEAGTYMCLQLENKLPHMVLDAKDNNHDMLSIKLSNLPVSFNRSQILDLGIEFSKYFTLYAPKEYEKDALYIFTPDLMALLIDNVNQYDIEIIDDKLYVYAPEMPIIQKDTIERMLGIARVIGSKVRLRTSRYKDQRVESVSRGLSAAGSNGQVHESGRRLGKRNVGVIVAVIFAAFVIYQIVTLTVRIFLRY